MRFLLSLIVMVAIGIAAAWALGFIDIRKTHDGKMPTITAKAGELPGFEVKTSAVEIGTQNTTVDVPTVGTRKETVQTPTVTVKKPQ